MDRATEGAKFWLKVFNELKNRGLDDILVTVVDGLRGFPEAIEAVYLNAQVQTCIVHLIRNSLNLASWKDRKGLAAALKSIYQAATADAAAAALESFAASDWGCKFPTVAQMWRRQWEQVIPFLAYPLEVRKIIYTTDEVDKRAVCFRSFMASVLVATERVPHLPAVALASSARTGVGRPARLARRLHAPDPGRTSDCRRRQTPCGYRDAQEAACLQFQLTGLSRSQRWAIPSEGFVTREDVPDDDRQLACRGNSRDLLTATIADT